MLSLSIFFLVGGACVAAGRGLHNQPISTGCSPSHDGPPVGHTKNGSYYGFRNSNGEVDYFLGIPFAQPPLGDLRFHPPVAQSAAWAGLRNATTFGYACVGYGDDTEIPAANYTSEDCLTLNVYRPSGVESSQKLPVLVWIYGGGFVEGTTISQMYNLTFIVEQSVRMGEPIIAVAVSYRLSGWGFLWSQDIVEAKVANLGLRDQRQSLLWVQENIAGFGGDPRKVTIWGESAGAASVGNQLLAYNGRDDDLFRAAVANSGPPAGFGALDATKENAESLYQNLTDAVGCADSPDKISCLRRAPFVSLDSFFRAMPMMNEATALTWGPIIDGDFIMRDPREQLADGSFVKVPFILGTDSDEGTAFAPFGINNDEELASFLSSLNIPTSSIEELLRLYPNDPLSLIPASHPGQYDSTIGTQFKRAATILQDVSFIGATKLSAEQWVKHAETPLYSYRFNTLVSGDPDPYGVTHGSDLGYFFYDIDGVGYPNISAPWYGPNPFLNVPESYIELADFMSRALVKFTNRGNPNYPGQPSPEEKCSLESVGLIWRV